MALRRFWFEAEQELPKHLSIEGDLFHHIKDVCRFGIGDEFELLTGDGNAHLVRVLETSKSKLLVEKIGARKVEPLQKPYIHLVLSIPRFATFESVLEKAVELGVHTVRPVVSDFSFIRETKELKSTRVERWQKIIRAGTQQSGRGELLELSPVSTLQEALKDFSTRQRSYGLFPYEGKATMTWKQAVLEAKERGRDEVWLFVGSEGGFSVAETELFKSFKINPMTMGAQILRVETACVALIGVIKYELEV